MMHEINYDSDAFIVQGAASQHRSIEILMKLCFFKWSASEGNSHGQTQNAPGFRVSGEELGKTKFYY
jgi:hypothetical protein